MDPLTHTLVGGSLAATRLGSTTRLATAALLIGANLPDLDVLAFVGGADNALAFRRGWTHGLAALVVLPALLAGGLVAWGRWRPDEGPGPPLSPRALLALSYLAVITHPCLDWLNTYGMRWLMPFDGTWFYGDSVFIVDPWLWLLLGAAWLLGREPSWGVALLVMAPGLLLTIRVMRNAPHYALLVVLLVALLLGMLAWRPRSPGTGERAAITGLALAATFVAGLLVLHAVTLSRVRAELDELAPGGVSELMVGPTPADPFAWDVVWVADDRIRAGAYRWLGGGFEASAFDRPHARTSEHWPTLLAAGEPRGLLGWARFPWLESGHPTPDPTGGRGGRWAEAERRTLEATATGAETLYLMDARYTRVRTDGFGGARVDPPGLGE